MWAIKNPDGTIDQTYVGETQRNVWFERGWHLMVKKYGPEWEKKFWRKEKPSIANFKKKGYSFIEVKIVPLTEANKINKLSMIALEVLETKERAKRWLNSKLSILGRKTPLEYAKIHGTEEVEKILRRIEQGIPL